jgi:hypothetical protein
MSKLMRLGLILPLLALSVPAFSGPIGSLPQCSSINGNPCRTAGQTETCTDSVYTYTCTCTHYTATNKTVWYCPPLK